MNKGSGYRTEEQQLRKIREIFFAIDIHISRVIFLQICQQPPWAYIKLTENGY